MDRAKFCEQFFEKGHPRNIPAKCGQIGQAVSEEKIFIELLKKFHFVAMATRVFDGIKICEQFLKGTSKGTFLPSMHDGHWTTLEAPTEHIVLR